VSGTDATSLQQHVRLVYALFAAAAIASCAYCVILRQFNGDFFPQPVYLSVFSLLVILVACLLPYWLTWRLAGFLERIPPHRVFEPSQTALLLFLLAGFAAQIAITVLYGVGVLDTEVYSAPPRIVPFIQVLNRLDPFYLGVFFILATPKRPSTDLLAIALMIGIGTLRAGLGAFAYAIIVIAIKYRVEIHRLFRRAPWLVASAALTLPTVVSSLYDIRGQLRGDLPYDYSISEMLLGRFVGRLSSFSNVAYIEQFSNSFSWASKSLEKLYYFKQSLVSLLGSSFAPSITPERLLISGTTNYEGYSSFMVGVPGNLMLAWDVSPEVAVLNLGLILATVVAILWMCRYLGGNWAHTFGLAMVIYPLTSGVANEFSSLLVNTAIFLAFSMIFPRRVHAKTQLYGS
jgi:hypothetical protein